MYYLYYLELRCSLDLCAAMVQLYRMYSLCYLVPRVSSNLCAAYLYYFDAVKKILRTLAAPTQLVPATTSFRPPPLKIQQWRSHSGRPPSTVDPPALPCPHRFHPTDQDCQAWPSKPIFNQQAKCCEPYLPLQAIFELTRQAKRCDPVPSFLNILPAPPSHFRTNIPRQALSASPVSPQHIICPSKPYLNRRTKKCEPFPSFLIILSAPPSHFRTNTPITASQSCYSSSDYLPLPVIPHHIHHSSMIPLAQSNSSLLILMHIMLHYLSLVEKYPYPRPLFVFR